MRLSTDKWFGRIGAVAIATAVLLIVCDAASAGSIETRADGTTVITLRISPEAIPQYNRTDVPMRADIAAIEEFKRRFSKIFADKYRAKYKANPKKYGNYNWDKVEIRLEQASGIKVEGSVETDLLSIAGQMAPDVLYVNFKKSDTYIRNNFLYPLDKPEDNYLGDLTGATITEAGIKRPVPPPAGAVTDEELNFRINYKIWPVIRRDGPDGKKHVWAMPFGGEIGKVLLYRKDLFDEKGMEHPNIKWTWDNLFDACKKLTDPERGIYGIFFFLTGSPDMEAWNWTTFLWSAGGEAMEYDEKTKEWKCVFDSPAAAKALDFYVRLNAEKWIDRTGKIRRGYAYRQPGGNNKWAAGEIGMSITNVNAKIISQVDPEQVGMVPVPLGPPDKNGKRIRAAELNSRMMGIFSQIKSPAIRDAAWEYIRWYDCRDAIEIKTRVMVEGGMGRFYNPKYLRMFGYPEVERLAPKGWSKIFKIAIDNSRPEPYGKNSVLAYKEISKPITKALQMMRAGEFSADEKTRLGQMLDILKDANAHANRVMIGTVSPNQRLLRNWTAAGVLFAIVVAFAFVFRRIIKAFTPPKLEGVKTKQLKWGFRRFAWAYILLIPAVGSILLWRYYPLARGSVMAFQDYRLVGESSWVWLRNFGDLLYDATWWNACYNTVRYSFLVISMTFLPPIILAILLQEVPRGKILFRTIYYLPAVITGLVMSLLWREFYDSSSTGALNALVLKVPAWCFLAVGLVLLLAALAFAKRMWYHEKKVAAGLFVAVGLGLMWAWSSMAGPIFFRPGETTGVLEILRRLTETTPEPYNWLGNPKTAMASIVFPMVWAGMGPGCLIYLAALKGIADDYYEAADVDGATFIDKITFIVFPILKPLILINFIGVFIASFYGATAQILVMTGGGANTETAGLRIFFEAYTRLKFGPATAMAWVLAFMLIGFTMNQLKILSRLEFKTTGGDKK